MEQLRNALSVRNNDEESGIMAEISESTTLSKTTRLKAFVICFAFGVGFSLLGTFSLIIPGSTGIRLFAVFYTLGNIVGISSTCFLMGPCNQLQRMFAETRIIATVVAIMFLILTLMAALWWKIAVLAILFCFFQFLAMIWYGLTYIPFARDAVKSCICSCLD